MNQSRNSNVFSTNYKNKDQLSQNIFVNNQHSQNFQVNNQLGMIELRKDFLDNFVAVEMADKQVAAYPLFNEDDYY